MRVVVIGSGFGGLATAIRLLARGHNVTVLERRDQAGGRAYTYLQDGFSFDGGPTVVTAPWMLRDLFSIAGESFEDHLELVPLDPFYRIFFHDGEHFDYAASATDFESEIQRLTGSDRDVAGYRRFVDLSGRIFDKGFTDLADMPFLKPGDMLRIAPDLIRLQSYRTVFGLLSRYIKDDRLRQILTFHPLLIGGNPFQTTSIYTLIHHLEREWGVWFAKGGTARIISELGKLIARQGGTIRLSTGVSEILVEDGRACGVRLESGEVLDSDIVVSNADVATTYRTMLPAAVRKRNPDRRFEKLKYSMSLVVIYFGTDRKYRDDPANRLTHHNIILGPRYRELLDDVFRNKVLADDFSLYLHMPTITDPTLAPENGDAFYVLAPVPHLGGNIDWETAAKPYRDRIIGFLEDRYLPELSRHIVSEHMIDPRHFEDTLGSYLGSAFSIEPILTQSAWFRPHNRSEDIPNLYFVGAGTHPGAGMPGVLSSAKIADDLIHQAMSDQKWKT